MEEEGEVRWDGWMDGCSVRGMREDSEMSYSQLRIEDVQVAQIVCVVGWAEPGQHQQQQSLHPHCSARPAPLLFSPHWSAVLFYSPHLPASSSAFRVLRKNLAAAC